MGCSNSKAVMTSETTERPGVLRNTSPSTNTSTSSLPKSVAFDVPLQENGNGTAKETNGNVVSDGSGKLMLPKRLQERLMEESTPTTLTAEDIEEKAKKAEERRQLQIEERLSKARASISLQSGRTAPEPPPEPTTSDTQPDRSVSRLENRQDSLVDERTITPMPEVSEVPSREQSASKEGRQEDPVVTDQES